MLSQRLNEPRLVRCSLRTDHLSWYKKLTARMQNFVHISSPHAINCGACYIKLIISLDYLG